MGYRLQRLASGRFVGLLVARELLRVVSFSVFIGARGMQVAGGEWGRGGGGIGGPKPCRNRVDLPEWLKSCMLDTKPAMGWY